MDNEGRLSEQFVFVLREAAADAAHRPSVELLVWQSMCEHWRARHLLLAVAGGGLESATKKLTHHVPHTKLIQLSPSKEPSLGSAEPGSGS